MIEIWKQIKDFPYHEVSNLGRVRSLRRWSGTKYYNRISLLSLYQNKNNGYIYVWLNFNGKGKNIRVHKLVAETFLSNYKNDISINHIDGNKSNNRLDNLEWCTPKENIQHYIKSLNLGERNRNIIKDYKKGINKKQIKEKYNLTYESIRLIIKKGWESDK